jgi:hypothetical protein
LINQIPLMDDFAASGLRIQGEYVRDGTKCQPFKAHVKRFKLQISATQLHLKEFCRL